MNLVRKFEPNAIPAHHYHNALSLDCRTAIPGDPSKQNYSVCPRTWYVNAHFRCETCGQEYVWLAEEQKVWFEVYGFWIDSQPRRCKPCQAQRHQQLNLQKEYDMTVKFALQSGTLKEKQRVIDIIQMLQTSSAAIPQKMLLTQQLLQRQIKKLLTFNS